MDPIVSSALSPEAARPLVAFVAKAPNSVYTINEKVKGSNVVDLCRGTGTQQSSCIEVHEAVTKVFALMQNEGFFCQLPFDPSHTEIECQRIVPTEVVHSKQPGV